MSHFQVFCFLVCKVNSAEYDDKAIPDFIKKYGSSLEALLHSLLNVILSY